MNRQKEADFTAEREFIHHRLDRLNRAIKKGLTPARVDHYEQRLTNRIQHWNEQYHDVRSHNFITAQQKAYHDFVTRTLDESLAVQHIVTPAPQLPPEPVPVRVNPYKVAAAASIGFFAGGTAMYFLPPSTGDLCATIGTAIATGAYCSLFGISK